GVKVRACYAVAELALVDFPGVVELTEGRDALKPGPAFAAVAAALHRRLSALGAEPEHGPDTRLRIAELAAQISALMLESAAFRDAAPELAKALLAPGRFLIGADRAGELLGGAGVARDPARGARAVGGRAVPRPAGGALHGRAPPARPPRARRARGAAGAHRRDARRRGDGRDRGGPPARAGRA